MPVKFYAKVQTGEPVMAAVMDAEGGEANAVDFSALTDEEICGVHRARPGDISRTLAAEGKE